MKTTPILYRATIFMVWLAATFFYQCTFDLNEKYVSSIKAPEPINVTFEVNDPRLKDPYYLLEPTWFHIRIKELGDAILSSQIRIDGKLVDSYVHEGTVSFILNPYQMEIREHTLEMILLADTKSGSLANSVGAEFYDIRQSVRIIIDPSRPVFHGFQAGFEDGYLAMRWVGPRDKNNFIYKLTRYNPNYFPLPDTTLFDARTQYFIDPGFVGGELSYSLRAKGFDFEIRIGEDLIRSFPVDFKLVKDHQDRVKLVWTKSEINPENVVLSVLWVRPGEEERSYRFSSSGELHLGELGFMEGAFINVYLHREGYSTQKFGITLTLEPTANLKAFSHFTLLKENNKLLIGSEESIYRYDLDGYILEDSLVLQTLNLSRIVSFVSSRNESRVYLSDDTGNLVSVDPLDFSKVNRHNLATLVPDLDDNPNAQFSLLFLGNTAENGILTVNFMKGRRYSMVVDTHNNKLLWLSPPGNNYPPTVSDDGHYLAVDIYDPGFNLEGWILKRTEGTYQRLGKIYLGDHYFLPGGKEVMTVTRRTEIKIEPEANYIKVVDFTKVPENHNGYFSSVRESLMTYKQELFRIGYDPISNYLWFTNGESIDLFSPSSMRMEKSYNGGFFLYANNYLLHRSGFIKAAE